jgi:hypothetical protein
VIFVGHIPKTRNAKVMRRIVRAAHLGENLGDTSALENRRRWMKSSARPQVRSKLRLFSREPRTQHVVWNKPPTGSVCASLL